MKKKKNTKKPSAVRPSGNLKDTLSLYSRLVDLKKEISKMTETHTGIDDRLSDIEIHINLLTRLLTTLCIEKFGIRIGVLKRLVRRIEKEAVRDSQIMELEFLYNLSHGNAKKSAPTHSKHKDDPWEQIS
jgi:hypothetical protein